MALTRTLTIPVAGTSHRLEGRLRALSPEIPLAVVAPPHPVYGGTIGNPVVRAIERAFEARGFSTLAFNFRGTGEDSTGEPSGEESDAKQDYLAAARSLPDTPLGWLSGYSFGSVAALASAIELALPRVLMVAPPLGMLDPRLLDLYRGQLIVVVGSEDEYAPLDAVRELMGPLASTQIEVIEGVEHFFHGSSAQRLSETLIRLLPVRPETPRHVP